jgi:hypothetical protein
MHIPRRKKTSKRASLRLTLSLFGLRLKLATLRPGMIWDVGTCSEKASSKIANRRSHG